MLRRIVFLLAALAAPAGAAEITDVADAADGDDPLDVHIDFWWNRYQHRAKITREQTIDGEGITPVTELRYQNVYDELNLKLTIGLYHDLELHAYWPFVIRQTQQWQYAEVVDNATGQMVSVEDRSTIKNNRYDANGALLPGGVSEPIFLVGSVGSPTQVFRAGFREPVIGVAWGPLNDERERPLKKDAYPDWRTTATWVFGFDYSLPVVETNDPWLRDQYLVESNPGAVGERVHRLRFWTALSKRMSIMDPYLRLEFNWPIPFSLRQWTYDNCVQKTDADHRDVLASDTAKNCDVDLPDPENANGRHFWVGSTGFLHNYSGGLALGAEIVAFESRELKQKVAFDLRLNAVYESEGRTYTEAADMLRKLTYHDQYFRLWADLQLYVRLAQYVIFKLGFSLGHNTTHFLTGETTGKDFDGSGDVTRSAQCNAASPGNGVDCEWNPNFDFRVDQLGRRLKIEESLTLNIFVSGAVNF
jgi:hypothetical protein